MKTLGIIAEYNPFHCGHYSHLTQSKTALGADAVVVVMSGNFVQRGEPALCDKWSRAKMALLGGADLVIELPLCIATSSAGYFAQGAVNILEKTGIVNCMCFGSESADITPLQQCAEALLLEDDAFKTRLKKYLDMGLSYPSARAKAADINLPDTPNNVLGVEYIKALLQLKSKIVPYTVPRAEGSAKQVRDAIKSGNLNYAKEHVPPFTWDILQDCRLTYLDNFSPIFHYILHTHTNLQSILDVSEGLENLLRKCAKNYYLISDIIASAKTKRYTYLRIQRVVLHMILGITKIKEPEYIRVLGFKKERADLLKELETNAKLPVVLNIKNANFAMLDEEICATKVYGIPSYINEYAMPVIKI